MLTSIHYFSQYRDYVLRHSSGQNNNFNRALYDRGTNGQATILTSAPETSQISVHLNKAYNSRVLQYVRILGQNIVSLKDASRLFVQDSGNLDFTAGGNIGFADHLRWIEEDLRNFAVSYNNLDYLSQRVSHSAGLADFTHSIRNITRGHEAYLTHLGIMAADEGGLVYHGIGNTATKEITRAAAEAFRATYEASRGFLEHPMTHHLEFRDLNYYYNYTIGNAPQDSFRLIESGLLIDRYM
ncbi:MAG: hypothetical protein LBE35_02445 [Clostridiales bacterium]|jgi:hypothetical protein|nr:hypothetical protein [Clostridiales bacterium]